MLSLLVATASVGELARIGKNSYTYLPMKIELTECPETSAYKIQTPGNYPEESKQRKNIVFKLKIWCTQALYVASFSIFQIP
jgi:hypothetical protein